MIQWQDSITIFLSIFVEALPFILIGTAIATFIKFKLKTEHILSFLPKSKIGKCMTMSCLGTLFPVCECGNVPVMKGLLQKEVPAYACISFLLGAPILNPIVIITTMVAFPDNPEIWLARILICFFIAVTIGYIFSFSKREDIIHSKISAVSCNAGHAHHNHSHNHNHEHRHIHKDSAKTSRQKMLDSFIAESTTMLSIISIGAVIAALSQTLIPRSFLLELNSNQLLAIIAMMTLAFIISICSTTDAFFALAYSHIFAAPALTAFLVFGPMIDIKILLLLNNILKRKAIIYIAVLAAIMTIAITFTWYKIAL